MNYTPEQYAKSFLLLHEEKPREAARLFATFLHKNNLLPLFPKIEKALKKLWNEKKGLEEVLLEASDEITATYTEKMLGKKYLIKKVIDPNLLSGIRLRHKSVRIDNSLRRRLETI